MYVKDYFKGGEYVTLIPIGLPITLQYNISGNLEKVYIGYDSNRRDVSNTFMMTLLSRDYVPGKINLTKGTSWVYGILYTNDIPTDVSGPLPECVELPLETKFTQHPEQFRFFAGNIECTSVPFHGSTHINQFLHLCRFNVLPGWIVPPVMDKSVFYKWINSSQYTFHAVVTGYIIFSKDGSVNTVSTCVSQNTVTDVLEYNDDNGNYRVKLTLDDNTDKYINYATAYKYGISKTTLLYLDAKGNIFDTAKYSVEYQDTIRCPFCGKTYTANLDLDEETYCPDVHCTSRLVSPIQRFITVMGFPVMSTEDIKTYIKNGDLTCVTDIFELEPYKSAQIKATIGKCLQAMIPISLIKTTDIFSLFSNSCSNDIKTILYYINHPTDIIADLRIDHPDVHKLIMWLSDDCNARDLTTVLELDQIEIGTIDKRFEGAPIFRNKLIYITGDFIHGNIPEISSILQSYSARVTTVFTNLVDCVLIGGTNENINGKDVVAARNMGIPIMVEQDFFTQYDIDTDLAGIV